MLSAAAPNSIQSKTSGNICAPTNSRSPSSTARPLSVQVAYWLVIARSVAPSTSAQAKQSTASDGTLDCFAPLTRNSNRCGVGLELELVAELGQLSDAPLGSDLDRPVIEVREARVLVL